MNGPLPVELKFRENTMKAQQNEVAGVQEAGEDKAGGESPKRVGSRWKRGSYTTMLNILQISKKDWKGEATEKGRGLGM